MTKTKRPLEEMRPIAQQLCRSLLAEADAFSRAEVAGSVRRCRPQVGDIEIVAEVDPEREFGATERIKGVLQSLGVRRADPIVRKDGIEVRAPWGEHYMKGVLPVWPAALSDDPQAVQLDLFIVRPPADWGVIFLIRTGSAEFSQAVVTRLHQYGLQSGGGRLMRVGQFIPDPYVPCPDEEAFFRLAHLPFVPPERRQMEDPETAALFGVEAAK
ncbi:MAG TPA: hypothetical protein VGG32_02565 [Thermoplasmata archaeon]